MLSGVVQLVGGVMALIFGAGTHFDICSTTGVPTSMVWFWREKKMKEKGYVLWMKMQEKGRVLEQRVYYSTTILELFRHYASFFNEFITGYILAEFARKTAWFSPKDCKRKGIFVKKNCKRKGMVSDTVFAHPCTKIRQLCPPPRRLILGSDGCHFMLDWQFLWPPRCSVVFFGHFYIHLCYSPDMTNEFWEAWQRTLYSSWFQRWRKSEYLPTKQVILYTLKTTRNYLKIKKP